MRERLTYTDHSPSQRAERHPEAQGVVVDLPAAGAFVGRDQIGDRAEAADELVGHSEPPRLHAQPTEILDGIAQVRELPIEHGADALGSDDEVPVPEVAVHEL